MRESQRFLLFYVAVASLLIIPIFVTRDVVVLMADALVMGIFAMSLDIVLGYTGLFSLAHASVWGSGAYAVVLTKIWWRIPILIGLGFSPIAGFVTGLTMGLICSRVSKLYFPILTLLIAEIYHRAFMYWSADLGAEMDLFILGEYYDPRYLYYFVLLVCLASYWISRKVMDSPFGLTLQAIRENEMRASFVGCNVKKYRALSMAFSGIFAGIAGGLHAMIYGMVDIHLLHWIYSSEVMALNVIGGMGTLSGPLIFGSSLSLLKFYLNVYVGRGYLITIGLILIGVALYVPKGLPWIFDVFGVTNFLARKKVVKKR